ncbi:glycosyltransferase [Bacillus paramycoides]|uniref:glycosyltransferase n=1 Tax=Bacillus paramycoides TaxID=2026194 RepID=UPI002E1C39E3|nr:glycosyltransferase [Bacillus paramycoides]
MNYPTISLCMIVKDEEDYLPLCLESVRHIVDEIIIVDTGSSDRTISIAESYGARVISYLWQYDFAAARNRGLQEAVGDWILWLDADEQLDPQEGKKLKELLTRDEINKYCIESIQFILINHMEDNFVEKVSIPRMVRNRPEYRFEGKIHEQIISSVLRLYPKSTVGHFDISIHHYGFTSQNVIRKNKVTRNMNLLIQAQAEEPENLVYSFYLGLEFYRCNKLSKALDHLNAFLAQQTSYSDMMVASAYKHKCMTLQLLNRHEELIRCSEEGITRFMHYVDLYHLKAQGLNGLGRTYEAIDTLRQAGRIGAAPDHFPSTIGLGSYVTYFELGTLHESLGECNEAMECYSQALLLNPDFLPAREARDRLI